MSKKSLRHSWHKGDMGMGQIAAVLLIVLPTLAFSVTFLISYWKVMQADYKIKLVANTSADFYNGVENISDMNTTKLLSNAGRLCPNDTNLTISSSSNSNTSGMIDVTVQYTTPDSAYFGKKTLQTTMHTYSYHDQNLSVVLVCQ